MDAIKTILKATFLGAFCLGFGGGLIGAEAALFIWPTSNLGPPVGAIEGSLIGAALGVLAGFTFGLVRVFSHKRKAGAEDLRNEKAEL